MSYKIVVDSSVDYTDDMRTWDNLQFIPLQLQIGDYIVDDDPNFDQDDFAARVAASSENPKSACPSPDAYASAIDGDAEDVYIITITEQLSGSYNSALQGVDLYKEDHPEKNKNVHVFNSKGTACVGTLIALEIKKLADQGLSFEEIVEKVEDFNTNKLDMFFCLGSYDALKNNGRLYALAAGLFEALKVKMICRRTELGNISPCGKEFNDKRAMIKMVNLVAKSIKDHSGDVTKGQCFVSYVCCKEKAEEVRNLIISTCGYAPENVTISKVNGLNTLYACAGGIVLGFTF